MRWRHPIGSRVFRCRQKKVSIGTGLLEAEDDEFIHVPFFGERCLYCGAAGLGLYYLRVYDVTGDKKYLDEAVAAADYIIATDEGTSFYEKTRNSEIGGVLKVPGWALGIYNGPTGEGLFYDRLYEQCAG